MATKIIHNNIKVLKSYKNKTIIIHHLVYNDILVNTINHSRRSSVVTHSADMIWNMQTLVYWMVRTTSSWRGGQRWPSGSASSPSSGESHHSWDSQYPREKKTTNWCLMHHKQQCKSAFNTKSSEVCLVIRHGY